MKNCMNCQKKPVWQFTNKRKLCKDCFVKYFEKKVFYTIRKFQFISRADKIGIAVSGGKDSFAVLNIMNKFCKKNKLKLNAILVDEGIKDKKGKSYRGEAIKQLKKYCKENKIKLIIKSFKDYYKFDLQNKLSKIKKSKLTSCYVCSILKRAMLNKIARQNKLTKIVTGHNLDDEAETILLNIMKSSPELLAKLGPKTGIIQEKKFVQRIKPLYLLSEKEIILYAKIQKLNYDARICPAREDTFRVRIRNFLKAMEKSVPDIKHNIVNSYLKLMPILKKQPIKNKKKQRINYCKICEEPCSQQICKKCQIIEKL